jgi:molybdate transport system ATP-binding protein
MKYWAIYVKINSHVYRESYQHTMTTIGNNSEKTFYFTCRPLVSLENANASFSGRRVLSRISWHINPGENWALIGPNGAGKTTLLRMIHGDIWPDPTDECRRIYTLSGVPQESPIGVKKNIALVSPEQQNEYSKNCWNMSGEEVVFSGFFDTIWLYEKPNRNQREAADLIIGLLGLHHLRQKGILSMSQGEARKILIARALVATPRILILDEFCNGLDISARKKLLHFIDGLTRVDVQILYATHRNEELIPSLTHYLSLDKGKIIGHGRMDSLPSSTLQVASRRGTHHARPTAAVSAPCPRTPYSGDRTTAVLQIRDADVFISGSRILHGINWEVKEGEHWAVLGRNGSGKSTLLKLITGELHPAWGGTVQLFGMPELVSLWDIRKMIGLVTPELQADFSYDIAAEAVVLSGFFSEIGDTREASAGQRDVAREWIAFFGLEQLCRRSMLELSYGEKRKVLIARAMVNAPRLLILDEPCNGLDDAARENFLQTLAHLSESGVHVIMITHHLDELIPSLTHALIMDRGKIVAAGEKESILASKQLERLFND